MKKLLLSLALVFVTAMAAHAQFGIVGGWTNARSNVTDENWKAAVNNASAFHAGVAYKIGLGPFFTLQPQLVYQAKASEVTDGVSTTHTSVSRNLSTQAGFVELELGMQLGIDLLALRPFLLLEPFIGYQVAGKDALDWNFSILNDRSVNYDAPDGPDSASRMVNDCINGAKNKFEYGFGVGGGLEILHHFQISVQWFMNAGKMYDASKLTGNDLLSSLAASDFKNIANYSGLKLSAVILF